MTKRKPKFKHHYSGPKSETFWRRLNAVKDESGALYLLGCTLQDLEARIFQLLELAEKILARKEKGT